MTRIVIGVADQSTAYDLRSALAELDGVELLFVAENTTELVTQVLRSDPDIVLVHDQLGPEPALQTVRHLSMRRPACAALLLTATPDAVGLSAAMDAGVRGLIRLPATFEELQERVAAAGDWAQQMRRHLSESSDSGGATRGAGRGRVITVVGAKGGVGTTTIATHLALDVVRTVAGHRVCLLDLDLEKGDVPGMLEVRHRASIADVAKVSDDYSARAVSDAVVLHESGLHLLLAPSDVRDVEAVTPNSLRAVLSVLRQEYDLVIIDAGSNVTPAQAAVVELGDEVVAVTTPDVLAMRGLRRSITMWESLGVRKETDVRILVNRLSKATTVSIDTVRQLTRAPVLGVGLPAMFRRLEPALNARDPFQIRDDIWWKTLRAIGVEIGLVRGAATPADPVTRPTRGGGRRWRGDSGSITVETVGVLPVMLLVSVLVWQVVLYGLTLSWAGHAANVSARAMSVNQPAEPAARAQLPTSVADDLTVTSFGDTVTVQLKVPLIAPGIASLPGHVTVTRQVVREPW